MLISLSFLDSLRDNDWPAIAGVTKALFEEIFGKFCGRGTKIEER
jgi:hypothetical protein